VPDFVQPPALVCVLAPASAEVYIKVCVPGRAYASHQFTAPVNVELFVGAGALPDFYPEGARVSELAGSYLVFCEFVNFTEVWFHFVAF